MRVLIALDGSTIDDDLMAAVAPWVRSSGSEAILLTVTDPREVHETARGGPLADAEPQIVGSVLLQSASPQPRLAERVPQAADRVHARHIEYLKRTASRYLDGVPHEVRVLRGKHVADEIAHFAETIFADLIAIGTPRSTGIRHVLFGSAAEGVMRKATVPVMVVKQATNLPSLDGSS